AAVERGVDSEIATPEDEPYASMFAGNTVELCPVGALTSRQYRFKARPWDLVRTPSICNGCAVGCNVEVHSRSESVRRLVARPEPSIDDGWLCDRGRFHSLPDRSEQRAARPMIRGGDGVLAPTSWDQALARAGDLLGTGGGVLASAGLSNEALWALERLGQRLPGALWPPAGEAWPVQGRIQHLQECRTIVLVGLDVWNDLPILALWIRKAVLGGAKLIVLGEDNGLWRDTSLWLKGDPLDKLDEVTATIQAGGPTALLAHPSMVSQGRARLEAAARVLGASGERGIVGAPLLGSNGRGASELAPTLAQGDVDLVLTSKALLAIGDEPWAELHAGSFARLVLATSQAIPEDPRIDVTLPMAHAYERQASITNLEGRVQHQEGGAAPRPHARADWGIVLELADRLGLSLSISEDLDALRTGIVEQHPAFAEIRREEALVARV
ncbi:MAG TPA: molybdopterin-dependent oxidoreductase, partial [Chloroflexota bacterium]